MSMHPTLRFRIAEKQDCETILKFIKELARYEKLEDEVVATVEILEDWLFEKMSAEVMFAVIDGKEVGFALYFSNFSTFLGKAGLYIEDIYVREEFRGQGIGTAMMKYFAQMADECGFGRVEWACLDWNTDSIEFYESLGAVGMDGWTTFRLSGDAIKAFANR